MLRVRLRLIVLAGLLAGGMALMWSPQVEGASAQSSRHEMQVTVVGENGRAVAYLWVGAHPYRGGPGEYQTRLTGAGGRVRFQLREGIYHLHIHSNRYDECTVFGENPEGRKKAVLAVQAGGSSEISITVAARDPLPVAKWVPCRFDVPSADPGTVVTLLYPGWNMVAWLGPETPVLGLFEAIPTLERASAWNAAEQRYQRRTYNSIPRDGLEWLTYGMGLWLKLRGEEPFEWERPASASSVLLTLHSGRNLVGWTGRDGTTVASAVERLGDSLVSVSRWDAETESYEQYTPGGMAAANSLVELHHGDALWVELAADARWWQSGKTPWPVVFAGHVDTERQAEIRYWADSTMAVFAERWGIEAPFTSYVGEMEPLAEAHLAVRGYPIDKDLCANVANSVVFGRLDCVSIGTYPHEYFHVLQSALGEYRNRFVPAWLVEGTASWAGALLVGVMSDDVPLDEHLGRHLTEGIAVFVSTPFPPLADVEAGGDFYPFGHLGYRAGYVATDWLVDHRSTTPLRRRSSTSSGLSRRTRGKRRSRRPSA